MGRALLVLASCLCLVVVPLFRALHQHGWSAMQISGARGIVGALILGVACGPSALDFRKAPVAILGVAATSAMSSLLYLVAIQHAPIGLVGSIMYLAPVWVAMVEVIKKRHARHDLVAIALGFGGCLLFTLDIHWDKPTEVLGVICALVVSIAFAAILIFGGAAARASNTATQPFWCLVILGVCASPTLPSATWNLATITFASLVGIISGAVYLWIYSEGLKRTSKTEASVIIYVEIIAFWFISLVYDHEPVHASSLLGACCIVAAGVVSIVCTPRVTEQLPSTA